MTSELSLRELVAIQSCQNPSEFSGLDAVNALIEPDPIDPGSVILFVHQDPTKITAGNQMHRLRKALQGYGNKHPEEIVLLDVLPPSHFKPAGPEADHAVVRARATIAEQLANLFARGRVQLAPGQAR